MLFNNKDTYDCINIDFENTVHSIAIVNEYKYLGLLIAKNDRKHFEEMKSKGKQSSCITAKAIKEFGYVDGDILKNTYEMLTLSKMRYGAELYFDKNVKDLNKIQIQFFKKFYHLENVRQITAS